VLKESSKMDRERGTADRARLDDLLVRTSRTFALSIPVLPQPLREEVTVAYLLRIADTLEDATAWGPERQVAELGRFAELLDGADPRDGARVARSWIEDPPLDHAGYLELLEATPLVLGALAGLAPAARRLISHHDRRTVERMAAFVARRDADGCLRLDDLGDLRDYCYAVAGIVGEMLTELFLLASPSLAPHAETLRERAPVFGEALQLVNILRDSRSDAKEGRLYLPAAVDRERVFALARADLDLAKRYVDTVRHAGAERGLVAFTALPVLLADRTLDRVLEAGPGAKLTRPEVAELVAGLDRALDRDTPVFTEK
jgi:farnesyl-diphosphate farnesyltransferase